VSGLTLSFRGSWSFDEVREALGDGLAALGDAPGPWEEVSRRALEDRNCAGLAFEGTWRRGEATVAMSAVNGPGDPYNGYGYDLKITLDAPRLTLLWRGGSMDGRVYELDLRRELTAAEFRALRAALAGRLGGDGSDRGRVAVANVEALVGGDGGLQREILTAALAQTAAADNARPALMKWKAALLAGAVADRLRACPADLDAWTEALGSPPEGFSAARLAAGCARLAPWDPSRPQHRLAPAWQWLPALGGSGEAPPGWRQLDDGADPTWTRPHLARNVAQALYGLDPDHAAEVPIGRRTLGEEAHGGALARARWAEGALPRAHVAWALRQGTQLAPHATVDWIWGDGDDDVLVLASRWQPEPVAPPAMFVSGTEAFQATVMAALRREEPFPWRPVARPLERLCARPPEPTEGSGPTAEGLAAAVTAAPQGPRSG
jgi:hypothetical protein